MPARKVRELLDREGVAYEVVKHAPTFHAEDAARETGIVGATFIKAVLVKLDNELAMVVIPASERLHLDALRDAVGARRADLAAEWEFRGAFPTCEVGAIPPFGRLFGLDVLMDATLADHDQVCFSAGSHRESVRMGGRDYQRLAQPRLLRLEELVPS